MGRLSISLAQMNIALGDTKKNFATMEKMTAEAGRRGSHLVIFPELWSTGYALDQAKQLASNLNAGAFTQISSIATQSKVSVCGSVLERRGEAVHNSAPFFTPNGRMVGVYRKIHLFGLMEEDKWLAPGSSPLTMDLPWGATSIAICYDLRFPELFRRYAVEGAKLIIIPAEWPIERVEHWRALLQARAIENQVYIAATNACGKTGDTTFGGNSMLIDPWGKIVVAAGEQPGLFTAEVELDLVDEVRDRITVLKDRRPELYEPLSI